VRAIRAGVVALGLRRTTSLKGQRLITQPTLVSGALVTLAFALASVAVAAQDRPNPYKSDLIDSLVHGVYCAEAPIDLEAAPDTAAGVVNIVPGIPEFRAVTTLVPAQIGIGFGVVLQTRAGLVFDPVLVTITHPPYPDTGIEVERWMTALDGDGPGLIGFSFEVQSELVTGPWTFEAEHEGDLLFRIDFEVVPPALVPDLAQGCSGAILS
jgi:hypothetical protein